jgi:spore coat protein U-like protein
MKTRKRIIWGVAVALGVTGALVLTTARTHAGSATASLSVSASVTNNCTISTAALAFGSYDPIVAHASSPLDGTGTVTIACTKNSTQTIGLGLGGNASGSQRRLNAGGADYLNYELYKEAARTNVWGNSGTALLDPGAAPSKAARSITVYGRVAAGQDVPAGSYTDSVVATVNF